MSATAFTPDKGTLFYAECTRVYEQVVGGGLFGTEATAQVVRSRDRSYSDEVLRCAGRDAVSVIAERTGERAGRPIVLLRRDYAFHPVGPEVIAALGLSGSDEA
jgi:hypothetical protein